MLKQAPPEKTSRGSTHIAGDVNNIYKKNPAEIVKLFYATNSVASCNSSSFCLLKSSFHVTAKLFFNRRSWGRGGEE